MKSGQKANTFVSTGESLLGFIMTEQADGTIVAAARIARLSRLSRFACFRNVMGVRR